MARIETRGGILHFVGGNLGGLEVKLDNKFWGLPRVRNRSFAELSSSGRWVLTGFLPVEQADEEKYDADYARWR